MTYLRSRAWVFAAVWAVGSPAAYASSASNGLVTSIATDMTGAGYAFLTNGTRTTKPACATENLWVIITPATDKAKAMYAAILTAAASGQEVSVVGTGTCDATSPTRESVSFIVVTP